MDYTSYWKIEENYEIIINDCFCTIIINDGYGYSIDEIKKDADTKIQAIWQAVVEFIQWKNKNNIWMNFKLLTVCKSFKENRNWSWINK